MKKDHTKQPWELCLPLELRVNGQHCLSSVHCYWRWFGEPLGHATFWDLSSASPVTAWILTWGCCTSMDCSGNTTTVPCSALPYPFTLYLRLCPALHLVGQQSSNLCRFTILSVIFPFQNIHKIKITKPGIPSTLVSWVPSTQACSCRSHAGCSAQALLQLQACHVVCKQESGDGQMSGDSLKRLVQIAHILL